MNILINVISDPFFIFGLIVTLAALWFAVVPFRRNGTQMRTLRDWVSREEWTGKTTDVPLETWLRTGAKHGEYYLYECYFSANFTTKTKKYHAKAAVRPNDIHKLKKGLTLVVKYSDDKSPKIAVMKIVY